MIAKTTRTRGWLRSWLLGVGLTLLATACFKVGPDYVPPEPDLPDVWHQELVRGLARGEADLHTWWTVFQDPLLARLMQRARSDNLDLRRALARVDESRAFLGIAKGERVPDLDAAGTAQRVRTSKEIAPIIPPPLSRSENFFSVGPDATWELDFWGRIRRNVESAEASLEASVEDYRDALVTLHADVGAAYVDVRTLQARLGFAESNVATQRATLGLVRDRNRAGLVGDLDVRQGELNLASTEASVPALRVALAAAVHRLGVLVGAPPATLWPELETGGRIPPPPDEVLVGFPANAVRQRPDVRGAERLLAAQTAQIGVATAALYPTFALSGVFAFEGIRGNDLFESGARSTAFGPVFRWNLFDGGRVRGAIRVEDARTEQALYAYEQTVLRALEDVENSLVGYVREHERREALERSAIAARDAVRLVGVLYRNGLTDFQNVLDTERALFVQEDLLAASEGLVSQQLIRLYRALGGGWAPAAPTAAP